MNLWFECKVKYLKINQESGREEKANESYLLDAVSYTEAEKRIYEELEKMISGEFSISRISKTNISEIVPSENGQYWYKAKVSFTSVDEESGKTKKLTQYLLVLANSIKEAFDTVEDHLSESMADYEVPAINISPIVDVFPFYSEEVSTDKE